MEPGRPKPTDGWGWIITISLLTLAIHLAANAFGGYGIFRDEFYYIACSKRLAMGYVDQPPLAVHVLALVRRCLGDSLFAIRLLPAILHSLTVLLTARMAHRLEGGRFAQAMAALAAMSAPAFLGWNSIFQLNGFDLFFWTLAAYLLLRIEEKGDPRDWLLLGAVIGLGLLNKLSMAWFAVGLGVALLLTREGRRHLRTPWPYLAALFALIVFLPYIIWNIQNHFAHLEFIRGASSEKYAGITRGDFLLGQILQMNPLLVAVWVPGLFHLLSNKRGRTFRMGGIIWVTVFLILLANGHSKAEYLASAYPPLFAAGACRLERAGRRPRLRWFGSVYVLLMAVSGTMLAPLAMPILPVKTYIRYARFLHFSPGNWESNRLAELPQFFADMFGWKEMARTVSAAYAGLPDSEKENCLIVARNYGEAGAIEYYGRTFAVPPVVSGHNSCWYWGREVVKKDYRVIIVIDGQIEDHRRSCETVRQDAVHRAEYAMPYENNLPIFVCGTLKRPLVKIWDDMKNFN